MRIDEKFNKREAAQVEVVPPIIHHGPPYELGVRVTLHATHDTGKGKLAMNMTAFEALEFAAELVTAATRQLKFEQEMAARKR